MKDTQELLIKGKSVKTVIFKSDYIIYNLEVIIDYDEYNTNKNRYKHASNNKVAVIDKSSNEIVYISSIGLRVLLEFQKRMSNPKTMKIINVKNEVMEVFTMTGFNKILTIV